MDYTEEMEKRTANTNLRVKCSADRARVLPIFTVQMQERITPGSTQLRRSYLLRHSEGGTTRTPAQGLTELLHKYKGRVLG